jgi:TonB family protein
MMEVLIYLLKINIAFTILFGFYIIFLRNDTFFELKRVMLLSIVFLSLFYPLITFSLQWAGQLENSKISSGIFVNQLEELIVTSSRSSNTVSLFTVQLVDILIYVYLAVVVFLFSKMFSQIYGVMQIIRKSDKGKTQYTNVLFNSSIKTPFSFFGYIVLGVENHNTEEMNEIISHEKTHVSQQHSIDVITAHLFCILCWFNPAVWLFKRTMNLNLEFLADKSVLFAGCDLQHYQFHLLRLSSHIATEKLINNFNLSPLKKRISMMNKTKTTYKGLLKYFLFVPVLAGLLFANNACTNQTNESNGNDSNVNAFTENADKKDVYDKIKEGVLTVCEEAPEYPGGVDELIKYLKDNTKYPVDAMEEGIQGKVHVKFIVTRKGNIILPEILKGVHPLLDKEALRVVLNMDKWIPGKDKGKAVDVYFVLPISFILQ